MGLFDKLFGKTESKDLELGDYLEMAMEGDVLTPPAKFYVKRVDLHSESDADIAIKELDTSNVIILNLVPLSKQPNRLKNIISRLKSYTTKTDGDIALLTQEMVLLTPSRVKIVKSRAKKAK